VRDVIRLADQQLIPQAKAVFTIARNVSDRLKRYNGLESAPLYNPPPNAEKFHCSTAQDYFFFPSRLTDIKRQELVLEALAQTRERVCVKFAGTADHPPYFDWLKEKTHKLKVDERVEWLGHVSQEEKYRLYAEAIGIVFTPTDEDYGYVTLEAMLASKPVVTCTDSGGPLEFIQDWETGLIAEPTPESLALAMDTLWRDRAQAVALGKMAQVRYQDLGISWQKVVRTLLS
jgi:glycosyltransferase involved in cell wall biosynthesis